MSSAYHTLQSQSGVRPRASYFGPVMVPSVSAGIGSWGGVLRALCAGWVVFM